MKGGFYGAVHICVFQGKRIVDPPPDPPFLAKRLVRGPDGKRRFEEVLVTPEPPKRPRIRCEGEGKNGRGRCTAWAVGGAMYPWGARNYCARCLDIECGPVETGSKEGP